MRPRPRTLKWKVMLFTLWAVAVTLGTVWYFHGNAVRKHVVRWVENLRLQGSEDAVVRGLAGGRFGPGASVEEFIAAHPPLRVIRHGRFTEVFYYRLEVLAMDGKLVYAVYSKTPPGHVFFENLTTADQRAYQASVPGGAAQHWQWRIEVQDARHAAGGAAGVASRPELVGAAYLP